MKHKIFALLAAVVLAAGLTGCSFKDTMLYLYGGDDYVKDETPLYTACTADNGVTVVYDANTWEQPGMAQDDTMSITAGNRLGYTVVLLQTTDSYTDFLAQSGQELEETTGTVKYDLEFTVPDASVQAVRYDCGSYQMVFAQLDYDCGQTIYVSAATRNGEYQPVIDLLQNVYPTGYAPADAVQPEQETTPVTGNSEDTTEKRQNSLI